MVTAFDAAAMLPGDWRDGVFLGRIDFGEGPAPVLIRGGVAYEMSGLAPTVSALIERGIREGGRELGEVDTLGLGAPGESHPRLLSPIDLQCVKATGVTFAVSAIERVIEERAMGDPARAAAIRGEIEASVGAGLPGVKPGSKNADRLKAALIERGFWSQYLEVAIGPYAEVFTKAPVLSTVGWGGDVGVRSDSYWNNPEPEMVVIADSHGRVIGAALGNDINLRDIEGRSALLLGKAKDNAGSCALGPFIRLFDERFTIDSVRAAEIELIIEGADGYRLQGSSSMRLISRDPLELVAQAFDQHHYPDGMVMFCGTMFAPTQDRDTPGHGFTHHEGDTVIIRSQPLGTLVNRVTTCAQVPAWTMGVGALMANLARRGLLA